MVTRLEQRHGLFNRRIYEIVGDDIVITRRTPTSGSTVRYPIFELSENTIRQYHREWKCLVWAAVLVLFSLLFFSDAIRLRDTGLMIATAILWAAALFCLYLYHAASQDTISFRNWRTHEWAFFLWNNNPDRDTFQAFFDTLLEKIRKIRVNPALTMEEKLEIYARYLQFLVDEDVIAPEEAQEIYDRKRKHMTKAKSRILGIVPNHS